MPQHLFVIFQLLLVASPATMASVRFLISCNGAIRQTSFPPIESNQNHIKKGMDCSFQIEKSSWQKQFWTNHNFLKREQYKVFCSLYDVHRCTCVADDMVLRGACKWGDPAKDAEFGAGTKGAWCSGKQQKSSSNYSYDEISCWGSSITGKIVARRFCLVARWEWNLLVSRFVLQRKPSSVECWWSQVSLLIVFMDATKHL